MVFTTHNLSNDSYRREVKGMNDSRFTGYVCGILEGYLDGKIDEFNTIELLILKARELHLLTDRHYKNDKKSLGKDW